MNRRSFLGILSKAIAAASATPTAILSLPDPVTHKALQLYHIESSCGVMSPPFWTIKEVTPDMIKNTIFLSGSPKYYDMLLTNPLLRTMNGKATWLRLSSPYSWRALVYLDPKVAHTADVGGLAMKWFNEDLPKVIEAAWNDPTWANGAIEDVLHNVVTRNRGGLKEEALREMGQIENEYEGYTGNTFPEKLHAKFNQALEKAVEHYEKDRKFNDRVNKLKTSGAGLKHWAQHDYPHRFNKDTEERSKGDVRSIGESYDFEDEDSFIGNLSKPKEGPLEVGDRIKVRPDRVDCYFIGDPEDYVNRPGKIIGNFADIENRSMDHIPEYLWERVDEIRVVQFDDNEEEWPFLEEDLVRL